MRYLSFFFTILSAIGVGIIMSLIGQALINYSYFSFIFVFLTAFFGFFTLVKRLQILGVLFVDIFFVLIIVLLRFYIMIADK